MHLTRGDALRACPWLLYFAPLALVVLNYEPFGAVGPQLRALGAVGPQLRVFGAVGPQLRAFGRSVGNDYSYRNALNGSMRIARRAGR